MTPAMLDRFVRICSNETDRPLPPGTSTRNPVIQSAQAVTTESPRIRQGTRLRGQSTRQSPITAPKEIIPARSTTPSRATSNASNTNQNQPTRPPNPETQNARIPEKCTSASNP